MPAVPSPSNGPAGGVRSNNTAAIILLPAAARALSDGRSVQPDTLCRGARSAVRPGVRRARGGVQGEPLDVVHLSATPGPGVKPYCAPLCDRLPGGSARLPRAPGPGCAPARVHAPGEPDRGSYDRGDLRPPGSPEIPLVHDAVRMRRRRGGRWPAVPRGAAQVLRG